MKSLHRRLDRFERAAGGDFPIKARAVAERLGVPAEQLLAVAKGHEAQLSPNMGMDGTITWEAFCCLRDLGAFA
jgi:hypothetical protein